MRAIEKMLHILVGPPHVLGDIRMGLSLQQCRDLFIHDLILPVQSVLSPAHTEPLPAVQLGDQALDLAAVFQQVRLVEMPELGGPLEDNDRLENIAEEAHGVVFQHWLRKLFCVGDSRLAAHPRHVLCDQLLNTIPKALT